MFVTFDKPAGGHPDYAAAGAHRVVIKPESAWLERALFGTQAGSLANQVNAAVGLAGADQITTYKQDVHARFGTLCERVVVLRREGHPGATATGDPGDARGVGLRDDDRAVRSAR